MPKWINEEALSVLTDYYYPRAKWLQENCNWGTTSYTGKEADEVVNDPLMQNVEIYDCWTRNAAGFSNVLQDLWFKHNTPKWNHQDQERKELVRSYDTSYWDLNTWLFVFMCHRNMGSGASFTRDHGYRNNVVQFFGQDLDINSMIQRIKERQSEGIPMFTSIGNQPPAPRKGVSNIDFLINEAPTLCNKLAVELEKGKFNDFKEIVDFLNQYNVEQGHRRFNFSYAALSYDIGDYFPEFINPKAHGYFGNNAIRCMKLMSGGYNTDDFMDIVVDATGGAPRDLEDVLCDGVRFMQNYIRSDDTAEARSDDTYSHIPEGGVKNNSGFNFGVEQRG